MSLTEQGFTRPRLAEIKTDYDQRFTDALGAVNTQPDSVVGQIIGIFSGAMDDAYEALQDTYDSMYPFSAEGTSLDGAVAYIGLSRIQPSATSVTAAAYGAEGTLVPAGTVAQNGERFVSTSDVVISRSNALCVDIEIVTVTNLASYQVIIGTDSLAYTSDASATRAEILAGLLADMPADFLGVITGEVLTICAKDGVSPFAVTVDEKMTVSKIGSPVVFVCVIDGAVVVPVGALVNLESNVAGVDSIYNLAAGSTGRNLETDAELRKRHFEAPRATGSATVEAIRARMIQEVEGATDCFIYENRTNTIVDGLPPHSFEAVVAGGSNDLIAQQLWKTKPAGIETYGNVLIQVTDSQGDQQTIGFSRAISAYAWVRVTVSALNPEDPLSSSPVAAIKKAVADYGTAQFGIGDDIITQRFFAAVYGAVTGLASVTIESAVTTLPTDIPVYTTGNVSILRAGIALFDQDRVTVTGVI